MKKPKGFVVPARKGTASPVEGQSKESGERKVNGTDQAKPETVVIENVPLDVVQSEADKPKETEKRVESEETLETATHEPCEGGDNVSENFSAAGSDNGTFSSGTFTRSLTS